MSKRKVITPVKQDQRPKNEVQEAIKFFCGVLPTASLTSHALTSIFFCVLLCLRTLCRVHHPASVITRIRIFAI